MDSDGTTGARDLSTLAPWSMAVNTHLNKDRNWASRALADNSLEWQNSVTGEPQEGTMNRGGIYKRTMPDPIMNIVSVEDTDRVLSNVEKPGGRIMLPKNEIKTVGLVAVIQET